MAEQQMISAFASSSNSSSVASSKKYDVFLSFRGDDTRKNFTSHLCEALMQKKVETYIDYRLQKGDEISPALIKAIEDSHVSVVILSQNYASSKWCLEELCKILECKKNQGQIVMPVFFNIDPSHVRKQTGSYEQAFAKPEGEPRCNKWKVALTEVANLAGWDSRERTEAELLKDIVGDILQKLTPRRPNQFKGLVGIEENCEQIESLQKIGSSDVRTLGLWGMGGIGKTTLATALYAKLSPEFEVGCFLAKVRENSSRHDGLEALRKELFSKLLGNENLCFDAPFLVPDFVVRRLGHTKVFIVLDDVATLGQLEYLIKDYDLFGRGSRVIVTTRNKQIFRQVDEVYEVKKLNFHHSLQLFCLTAFEEEQPKQGYEDLSRSAISYCKDIPLALKVMGASLRGRSKEAWESELRKVQKTPNMEIHNILELSYYGLDWAQKNIFLDIACFFKGEARDWVTSHLEACGFSIASGIEVLLDKALITISGFDRIEMHDLIQQMGQEIVRQECIKNPGRRSRIWKPEEVREVLKYNKGTDDVEGIILDLGSLTEDLCLSSDFLTKMSNMRFLKIYRRRGSNGGFNVYLPNGLESLPYKLTYLCWDGFCLESLPSSFCAEQLVEFRMAGSKVKKLWDGVQNLVNLKEIALSNSRHLMEIPNLSKAKELERFALDHCESLRQLHPSILSLPKLRSLFLRDCREVESLNVLSKSLCELYAIDCSSLKEFSVASEEMRILHISNTAIYALPSFISRNRKLFELWLEGCNNVGKLSPHIKSITSPDHSGCIQHNASNLPFLQADFHNIGNLLSLETLHLSGFNVESLPANIKNLSLLRNLYLHDGRKLVSLPELPPSLQHLDLRDCRKLVSLPELPPSLEWLELNDFRKLVSLPELPPSLGSLDLHNCRKLVSLPELPPSLSHLWLHDCRKLVSLPELPPSLRELWLDDCRKLVSLPELPPSLGWLDLRDGRKLVSLLELPPSLQQLDLRDCRKLVSLPELPPSLGWLDLHNCRKLVSLPELPPSLQQLDLRDCRKLVSLPELPPSLQHLDLHNCKKLVSLPELPPSLKELKVIDCPSLDTGFTQRIMLQHMLQNITHLLPDWNGDGRSFIAPGDHVTVKCGFRTTGSSMTIPHLPLSDLYGFIYCIILAKESFQGVVSCSIRQDGKQVGLGNNSRPVWDYLISDHVIFWCGKRPQCLFSDIPIEFEFYFSYDDNRKHENGQVRIKECVVLPIYDSESGLKVFGSSSKEIIELESVTDQIFTNESQPRAIGVGGSNNENELEWDQLLHVIISSV